MLKLNCVKGMSVTTTGDTLYGKSRTTSACCINEKTRGYVKIRSNNDENITIEIVGFHTEFLAQNVHPYFGGECNA